MLSTTTDLLNLREEANDDEDSKNDKLRFVTDSSKSTADGKEPDHYTIRPDAGFCIKTRDRTNHRKAFINICHSKTMPAPKDIDDKKLIEILESTDAMNYRVPMSIGEPHEELDNRAEMCNAYDIMIASSFFEKVLTNDLFYNFLLVLAIEGVENKFEIELSRETVKLKNKKCMGKLQTHMIRAKSKPLIMEMNPPAASAHDVSNQLSKLRLPEPRYTILKEPPEGDAEFLIAEIHLPEIRSAKSLTLDVGEDRIVLNTRSSVYHLDIFLPYYLKQEEAVAQFNRCTRILSLTLPVASAL